MPRRLKDHLETPSDAGSSSTVGSPGPPPTYSPPANSTALQLPSATILYADPGPSNKAASTMQSDSSGSSSLTEDDTSQCRERFSVRVLDN